MIVTALVIVAYEWLDLSIATWVHRHPLPVLVSAPLFPLTQVYDPLVLLAYAGLCVLGLNYLSKMAFTRPPAVALAAVLGIIITDAGKVLLKSIFGRSPPAVFFSIHHPGQVAYGFNWFYAGASSFPSGHMAAACALFIVLWRCYPRGRAFYVLGAASVAATLILLSFHFLSDIIAGAFLGGSVGWWMTQVVDRQFGICPR